MIAALFAAVVLATTAGAPFAAADLLPASPALREPSDLAAIYKQAVGRRLVVPDAEIARYAALLAQALAVAEVHIARPQFALLVDRSPDVQAGMIWWTAADGSMGLVGAFPVSTGRPSGFEHFETPRGTFEHTLDNPDYRALGTPNELGIRGYGERGRRVYDFGWVSARRGWAPGEQAMRLQVHATDPVRLEPRLGERASKGCIRIPADVNEFIDRYAILDAAYDEALAQGHAPFWVLRADRVATPWSGRWLVVLESQRSQRPTWAVPPRVRRVARVHAADAAC